MDMDPWVVINWGETTNYFFLYCSIDELATCTEIVWMLSYILFFAPGKSPASLYPTSVTIVELLIAQSHSSYWGFTFTRRQEQV